MNCAYFEVEAYWGGGLSEIGCSIMMFNRFDVGMPIYLDFTTVCCWTNGGGRFLFMPSCITCRFSTLIVDLEGIKIGRILLIYFTIYKYNWCFWAIPKHVPPFGKWGTMASRESSFTRQTDKRATDGAASLGHEISVCKIRARLQHILARDSPRVEGNT